MHIYRTIMGVYHRLLHTCNDLSTNKNNAFTGILLPTSEKIYRARLKKAKDVKIVTNIEAANMFVQNKREYRRYVRRCIEDSWCV